jgi:hypothetical protein
VIKVWVCITDRLNENVLHLDTFASQTLDERLFAEEGVRVEKVFLKR